jgi:hypothetical protein
VSLFGKCHCSTRAIVGLLRHVGPSPTGSPTTRKPSYPAHHHHHHHHHQAATATALHSSPDVHYRKTRELAASQHCCVSAAEAQRPTRQRPPVLGTGAAASGHRIVLFLRGLQAEAFVDYASSRLSG